MSILFSKCCESIITVCHPFSIITATYHHIQLQLFYSFTFPMLKWQIQIKFHYDIYQWLLAQGLQRWHGVHICQLQSHWRRWWRSHHVHPLVCCWASGHRAGYRVPDSTAPSRCSPSGRQPGQRGQRYTHAVERK